MACLSEDGVKLLCQVAHVVGKPRVLGLDLFDNLIRQVW